MAFSYVMGFLNHNFHHYSFPTYGLKSVAMQSSSVLKFGVQLCPIADEFSSTLFYSCTEPFALHNTALY